MLPQGAEVVEPKTRVKKYAEFFFSAHFPRNHSQYQETYPGTDDLNIGGDGDGPS